LNGVEKHRLRAQEQAGVKSRCVGNVRLKIDVGREYQPGACNTQLSSIETGCKKGEWQIVVLIRSQVGQDGRSELVSASECTVVALDVVKERHDLRNSKGELIGVLIQFTCSRAGPLHTIIASVVL